MSSPNVAVAIALTGLTLAGCGASSSSSSPANPVGEVLNRGAKSEHGIVGKEGFLHHKLIEGVVKDNLGQIWLCHERQKAMGGEASNKVQMEWIVKRNGMVRRVRPTKSRLHEPDLLDCFAAKIRRWRFPKPHGGEVEVKYPFTFQTL